MAVKIKISDLSQSISVGRREYVEVPNENPVLTWVERFSTVAFIQIKDSSQAYMQGMDEKSVYYTAYYRYHPDRYIHISDQVMWGDKELKPVGDASINEYGNKRYFKQLLKWTSV